MTAGGSALPAVLSLHAPARDTGITSRCRASAIGTYMSHAPAIALLGRMQMRPAGDAKA